MIASATWLHTEVKGYNGINAAGQAASFDGKPALALPGVLQVLAVPPLHGGSGGARMFAQIAAL